ncbi:MAG TPA: hypothetical protein VHW23_38310 [Kofleriaceae bacterium]|nr:hypothetical protein [Kofleriaceae bacterium]
MVAGCESVHTYRTIAAPPDVLRAALSAPAGTVPDDMGKATRLDQVERVVLPAEPPLEEQNTTIAQLASACRAGAPGCPLEQRNVFAQLVIPTGTEYEIKPRDMPAVALIGAAAAGEVYCFAECSTGVKIGLVVTDILTAIAIPLARQLARGLAN